MERLSLNFRGNDAELALIDSSLHIIYKNDIFTINESGDQILDRLNSHKRWSKYYTNFTDFYNSIFSRVESDLYPLSTINTDIYNKDRGEFVVLTTTEQEFLDHLRKVVVFIEADLSFRSLFITSDASKYIEAFKYGFDINELYNVMYFIKSRIAEYCNEGMEWFVEIHKIPKIYTIIKPSEVTITNTIQNGKAILDNEGLLDKDYGSIEYSIPYNLGDAMMLAYTSEDYTEIDKFFNLDQQHKDTIIKFFKQLYCKYQ